VPVGYDCAIANARGSCKVRSVTGTQCVGRPGLRRALRFETPATAPLKNIGEKEIRRLHLLKCVKSS